MKRSMILVIIASILGASIAGYFGYRWYAQRKSYSQEILRTLAIIKPDAVRARNTGKILDKIEQEGFTIVDIRKVQLEREQAEKFYEAHKGKSFFHGLVDFMSSGPIVVVVLEKMNAVQGWRDLMGATDPAKAQEGTIRKLFGTNVGNNAAHGSDSLEAAEREIKFFFTDRMK